MTKKIKIEDNFLKQEKFDELQTLMMVKDFPWYFRYRYYTDIQGLTLPNTPKVDPRLRGKAKDETLDQFQFTHTFYDSHAPQSPHMQQVNYFFEPLQIASAWRIRANLLTRLPSIVQNPFHTDMMFLLEEKQKEWTTSIFYVNTNNGFTVFEDGTKVESVANRMLTFPANMKHTGTTCTDQQTRIVINFNYYKVSVSCDYAHNL